MKEIFYVPVLLSLLIVISVIIENIKEENSISNSRQKRYSFYIPKRNKKYNPHKMDYSEGWVNHMLKNRILIEIRLDGRQDEKEKKFELVQYEARKLKFTYDIIHVLAIRFTNENTFGDFVSLINLCQVDHHRRYTFIGDIFYIFGEDKNGDYPD